MSETKRKRFRAWMILPVIAVAIGGAIAFVRHNDDLAAERRLDRVEASAKRFTQGEVLLTSAYESEAGHICGTFATWGGPAGRDAGAFDESPRGVKIEVQSKGFSATDEGCVARTHDLGSLLEHRG